MTIPALSRLVKVDLREVWKDEAADFTPWLAQEDNLRLLGETIGIELQLEATEKNVGPFFADILCRNTLDDSWVLIENQLEKTNHSHLGQLLTYAAGLRAVTIVWLAYEFREEHRAALDWLNENTGEHLQFFGLEIEAWRIADSPYAPKFNLVSKPNDWSKAAAGGAGKIEPRNEGGREFWWAFKEWLPGNSKLTGTAKPHGAYLEFPLGRGGFWLRGVASFWDSRTESYDSNELRAEFVVGGANAKAYFAQLEARKAEIESAVGEPLSWFNPPDAKTCRVFLRRDALLEDRTRWPEYFAWLATKLEALHRVFSPIVRTLEIDDDPAETQTIIA